MNNLLDDCKQILTELGFASRWAEIEMWHEIGKRLCTDKNFKLNDIERLSFELEKDEEEILQAILFYKRHPDLSMMPGGKNISWYLIRQSL